MLCCVALDLRTKMFLGFLLIPLTAFAGDDFVIRGDQPTSIISEIPIEPKIQPQWLRDDTGLSVELQLQKLFADIELFTKPSENNSSEKNNQDVSLKRENVFIEEKAGVQP